VTARILTFYLVQWQTRADVVRMCEQHLLKVEARRRERKLARHLGESGGNDKPEIEPWCSRPAAFNGESGLSHKEFLRMAADAPFVACPHGGGVDPSPKAWEALLLGSVPIVQRGFVDDAYARFPVAFVDRWVGVEQR